MGRAIIFAAGCRISPGLGWLSLIEGGEHGGLARMRPWLSPGVLTRQVRAILGRRAGVAMGAKPVLFVVHYEGLARPAGEPAQGSQCSGCWYSCSISLTTASNSRME